MTSKSSRGTNIVGVRAFNDRLVLTLIRKSGKISKAAIARETGLSGTAISAIVNKLEKKHLVKREKLERGRVGQPSMPFSIRADGAYSLGLKIGRRSSELVLIDFLGNIKTLEIINYSFPEKDSIIRFAQESSRKLYTTLSESQQKRIVGIGVSMPNEIWKWEQLFRISQANLTEWHDETHFKQLEDTLNLPVYPMNDASAACGAELTLNNNLKAGSFFYFFIGWFIGGGVVIENKLYPGRSGNAGAIGSMLVQDKQGSLKQLIYVSSISALEEKLLASNIHSEFKRNDEDWQNQPQLINQWIDESASGIAQACVSVNSVMDFEKIIIDGIMPAFIRKQITQKVIKYYNKLDTTGLTDTQFQEGEIGPQARSIGAACLPLIANFSLDYEVLFKDTNSMNDE